MTPEQPAAAASRRIRARVLRLIAAVLLVTAATVSRASAGDRYALIVTGASGGPLYAQKYDAWRASLVGVIRDRYGYPADHVFVLGDSPVPGVRPPTAANVRHALTQIRQLARTDDVVIVLLIGHGTAFEGDHGKFNLVGPDLTADQWADLVRPIASRLVFVDTSAASFPFLRSMAAPGRVVLTATDSPGQLFETVFPEFFVAAFSAPAADADKNQKVSVWEAFVYASSGVKTWYEERGQLPTERAALDDDGGRGAGASAAPEDLGSLARVTYLQPDVQIPASAGAELAALYKRRAELELAVERLRLNKPAIPAPQYERDLEALLLEMARIDRQIRAKP